MTVQALPWSIQGQSHQAEIARSAQAGMLGAPLAAFTNAVAATTAGGSHGVVGSGDLAVSQNGTPNMSVNVAAGRAFIRSGNASSIAAGTYAAMNDAVVNVAISAADPTNPRIDLVVLQVRDTNYGEAASDARLTVVTGTPAASPAVPALTAFPNALVLAQVAVGAAVSSILTANITDKRTRATGLGGVLVCTSTTQPTGASLYDGLVIWLTDTKSMWVYNAALPGFVPFVGVWTNYTPTFTNVTGGTPAGRWQYLGAKTMAFQAVVGAGGTATAGGTIGISLPSGIVSGAFMAQTGVGANSNTMLSWRAVASATKFDVFKDLAATSWTAADSLANVRINGVIEIA